MRSPCTGLQVSITSDLYFTSSDHLPRIVFSSLYEGWNGWMLFTVLSILGLTFECFYRDRWLRREGNQKRNGASLMVSWKVDKLAAKIDKAVAQIAQLTETIADLQKAVAENAKLQANMVTSASSAESSFTFGWCLFKAQSLNWYLLHLEFSVFEQEVQQGSTCSSAEFWEVESSVGSGYNDSRYW